ncbi:MAG: hypothetical protein RMK80_01535, partial [Pseudobdellovibrionaceae bacterium]|nr:hypothetical protein [Pseudobdellovibrionaceae bacterium]
MQRGILIVLFLLWASWVGAQPESSEDFPPPPNFDEMEFSDFPGAITPPGASSGNSPSFNTINSEQNFSNPS